MNTCPDERAFAGLSIVVPVYNEAESLERLHQALAAVVDRLALEAEIIFVDDGSNDGGAAVLDRIALGDDRVRVVRFRRNFGQTAALRAGFDYSRGEIIITLDADLQNDPEDIPKLLAKLDEGYDVVSGWRKERKDYYLRRRAPSWAGNRLIRLLTGVKLHDFGCTLKAYRREVIKEVSLYGEMHRMIPVLAHLMGAGIAEVEVRHHPRAAGKSKYAFTLKRVIGVLLDLITLKFFLGYFTRPIQLFGLVGIASALLGVAAFIAMIVMKITDNVDMTGNPFLILGVFFTIVGTQVVMVGLLSEVMVRTYFESQGKSTYVVKEVRERRS